jgi:hypothetical protein
MKKIGKFTRPHGRYDFARMASEGGVWELAENEDYGTDAGTLRRSAYQWGRRNGYKVATSIPPAGGTVEIEFTPKG